MGVIRTALFARVSTGKQNTDRQIHDLTVEAARLGVTVVESIIEQISGSTSTSARPQLLRLLELARSRQIDKVLVSEISRLGRRTSEVLNVLEELTALQVSVYVLNYRLETLLPTGKPNPMAQFLFTLIAEFARLERENLVERIKSGQDNAKRKGKHIGRPAATGQDAVATLAKYPRVVTKLSEGLSIRDVAAICEVAEGTVKKVKKLLSSTN